jgi:transcriptional regulator with XRE-family HTH domain
MTTKIIGTESVFFGKVVKAMNNRGISTLKELSEKVKISGATINGWKKEGSIPQRRTLKTLSETLNVPPEWLLGKDVSEPNWKESVSLSHDKNPINTGQSIPNYCLRPESCTYANNAEQQREARLMSIWGHWQAMASQSDPSEIDAQASVMRGIIDRYAALLKSKSARGEKV